MILFLGLLFLGGIILNAYKYFQINNNYKKLNKVLDEALAGKKISLDYDESKSSQVESKLHRFISMYTLSKENIGEENKRVKSLIGDISHQTKTALSNILMYSELLNEMELSEEAKTYSGQIVFQAEKLKFLIDSLIKTSRLESGIIEVRPERNDINSMLIEVIESSLKKAEERSISINYHEGEKLEGLFDFKWTREAVYNILDNAIKYSYEGGQVDIAVRSYEFFIRIDLVDYGMGIDEEDYNKVFQRFYRGQEAGQMEGVGIGLYLASEIIKMQAGYIKLDFQGGRTMFSVFIPI